MAAILYYSLRMTHRAVIHSYPFFAVAHYTRTLHYALKAGDACTEGCPVGDDCFGPTGFGKDKYATQQMTLTMPVREGKKAT